MSLLGTSEGGVVGDAIGARVGDFDVTTGIGAGALAGARAGAEVAGIADLSVFVGGIDSFCTGDGAIIWVGFVGYFDGVDVRINEGSNDGELVGSAEATSDGVTLLTLVGCIVGSLEGDMEG